jgi:hypothetical protein
VANTTIFVRFTPSGLGARGGNITHESEGAETRTVAVSGTGANAYTISGTVTNNTGTGLAGVPVTLASGETPIATTTTDSNGNYSFTGVAGGGEYIVNATSAGFTFTPASQTFSNLSENRTANFSRHRADRHQRIPLSRRDNHGRRHGRVHRTLQSDESGGGHRGLDDSLLRRHGAAHLRQRLDPGARLLPYCRNGLQPRGCG